MQEHPAILSLRPLLCATLMLAAQWASARADSAPAVPQAPASLEQSVVHSRTNAATSPHSLGATTETNSALDWIAVSKDKRGFVCASSGQRFIPWGFNDRHDDFETGTIAAACGGTTTILDFANQQRGKPIAQALASWHLKAGGKAAIDYGFHMTITDLGTRRKKAWQHGREGVTSFKLLMAYPGTFMVDDETIFGAAPRGGPGGAGLVHAENGIAIDCLVREAVAAGHTGPLYHPTHGRRCWRERPPSA